jgi:predicted nucleotidyltransferase component of viral defense system
VSSEYEEGAEFIKLFLPAGEIDIVAGASLMDRPYEVVSWEGRELKVETCVEIIAKKMWHRGDRAKARDLYDLCAVADSEPAAITEAAPRFLRHGAAFLVALQDRADIARREFEQIDAIGPARDFDQCLAQARAVIEPLLGR